jgi:D-arabinan exo alpha-(1,3)/(1,5)-arabinofuranosidase (non-reducing end)
MRLCRLVCIALLSLSCVGIVRAAAPITTASLVGEMTDMERLTRLPDPWYRTVQFSSYDRRAQVPGMEGWFSNSDGFGGEPIPNFVDVLREPGEDGVGEYLVCDIEGPGAIVRVWTAAIGGRIEMYLDGADEPIFDDSADNFFRRPYDVFAREVGVDPAIYAEAFHQNQSSYCPIPFRKGCRIVWIGKVKEIHFYEVQVRVYEAGANVVTFEAQDLAEMGKALGQAAQDLVAGEVEPADSAQVGGERVEGLAPGASAEFEIASGAAGAITHFAPQLWAEDLDAALRSTVMRLYFDGAPEPQVEAPMGDFFGAAPGVNPYISVPFVVQPNGRMISRYVMPFADSARVVFINKGEEPVEIDCLWALDDTYEWDADRSLHFRARWRIDHDLLGDPQDVKDLAFLLAQGKGRYVGTTSMLLNPTDVPSPAGGWWGEGDEKIFVDEETFPSTFGTGSEDYYNYAWSRPDNFAHPYCGQPRNDGPGNRGFVVNNRWHIMDDLPFAERIAFYMELYPHKRVQGFSYARIGYYYARPGTIDDHAPISMDDVRPVALAEDWQPEAYWGAANSTFLEAENLQHDGDVREFLRPDPLYSGGACYIWEPQAVGEVLRLSLDGVEELTGKCQIGIVPVLTANSGKVEMRVLLRGEAPATTDAVVYQTTLDLKSVGTPKLRRRTSPALDIIEPGHYEIELKFIGEVGEEVGIDHVWLQKRG